MAADISIHEFARRICTANHTMNDRGNPARPMPCPEHLQIARQSWGLIEPNGQKTLDAIVAIAVETGVRPTMVGAIHAFIEESHMEGDIRFIDKMRPVDVTITEVVPHG